MPDSLVDRIRRRGPLRVVGYRSFGTRSAVHVRGRVLANPEASVASPGERSVVVVARMAERFLTREVAGVDVEVTLGRTTRSTQTNADGYFGVDVPLDESTTPVDGWIHGEVDLPGLPGGPWPIEAVVVDAATRRLVISDVDDTLLVNGAGNALRTVLTTLGGSALTRQPVPGTPELYREVTAPTATSPRCPVFYISSSPWNLYDFLVAFMAHHDFPSGPLLLRDFGFNAATLGAHGDHKVKHIEQILALCPEARVVLIGDSSQQDATAFSAVIGARPDRISGAFIRDVGEEAKSATVREIAAATGGRMGLVQEAGEIGDHLRVTDWFD